MRTRAVTRVADVIRARIHEGRYQPGARLDAEPRLAAELDASRATLREALTILSEEGLVRRRHGIGTFVSHQPVMTKTLDRNFGVTELIRMHGFTPGTAYRAYERVVADEPVCEKLGLAAGAEVDRLTRVRTADGRPVVYSLDYAPAGLWGGAACPFGDERLESVYASLAARGQTVAYGTAAIKADTAEGLLAERLEVAAGTLLVVLYQVDYNTGHIPLLYSVEYHLNDAFEFSVLRRPPTDTTAGTHG